MAPPGVARRGEKDAAPKGPPPQTGAHLRAWALHGRRPPKRRRGPHKPGHARARCKRRAGGPSRPPSVTPFALASDKWPLIRRGPPGSPPLALRVNINRYVNLGGLRARTPDCQAGGRFRAGGEKTRPRQRRRREEGISPEAAPCAKTRPLRARRGRLRAHFGAVGRQRAGGLGWLCYTARCGGGPVFHRLMGVPRCSGASRVKSLRSQLRCP